MVGRIPELDLDLLGRHRQALRRVRHLRLATRSGPGYFDQHLRQQHVRLGLLHRRLPGLQRDHRQQPTSEGNDLGYSGSNSGGHLVIENSEFNNNEEGVATQSQNNDDAPSPQDGLCPEGKNNP